MEPEAIRTQRLNLAPWCDADAVELRALLDANDAHLRPWIPFMRHEPRDLEGTRAVITDCQASFAAGEHLRYGIRVSTSGALVGEVMPIDRGEPGSKELGYWLSESATGAGYATEASKALAALAFGALALDRIEIVCDLDNTPSIKVAERVGGVHDRTEDGDACIEGGAPVRLGVWVAPAS